MHTPPLIIQLTISKPPPPLMTTSTEAPGQHVCRPSCCGVRAAGGSAPEALLVESPTPEAAGQAGPGHAGRQVRLQHQAGQMRASMPRYGLPITCMQRDIVQFQSKLKSQQQSAEDARQAAAEQKRQQYEQKCKEEEKKRAREIWEQTQVTSSPLVHRAS